MVYHPLMVDHPPGLTVCPHHRPVVLILPRGWRLLARPRVPVFRILPGGWWSPVEVMFLFPYKDIPEKLSTTTWEEKLQ